MDNQMDNQMDNLQRKKSDDKNNNCKIPAIETP